MKAYSEYVKAADGKWLVEDTYSIADIAVGCAIAWVDFLKVSKDWRGEYPELAKWYEALSKRESFEQTAPVMFDVKAKVV